MNMRHTLIVGFVTALLMITGVKLSNMITSDQLISSSGHIISNVMAKDSSLIEVFVVDEHGRIHFWQETNKGRVVEGSKRYFQHVHPLDSAAQGARAYKEFTISTDLYQSVGVPMLVSYDEAKFLNNLLDSTKGLRLIVIKVANN